ncbi:hypothetical protein [Pseudoclavibacter helvolus]|uniref:Uncharacterized protein n=1 Tax=Pseudoclavibacter helvolus TaxID=255205 RepID=A0A7W4YEY2_9MICO|nr:hypothetical protein [Pseudoclavibacter helvolus]MBB2956988.1 hypothetical protein [Pseudoclavibacter helvolus]
MAEQEYTPTTEFVRRHYAKGPTAYYEDGTVAKMPTPADVVFAGLQFDRWLTAHDAEVRADERAKHPDLPCDGGCNVNDGPMEDCSQHGRSPRDLWGIIEDLSQRLAAERAKRPDREQIARALFEADGRRNYDGSPTPWHILDLDEQAHYRKLADAVLSSLALEPEAREEHRPVDIEPSDTVCAKCSRRQGDGTYAETVEWPCALAESREVTDAEVEAARVAYLDLDGPLSLTDALRVALEAAREVSRG